MRNQIILWALLILPWLSILFFNKEDKRRYMPAALFTIVTSAFILDMGTRIGWWAVRENIFPLNEIISITFGLVPVSAIWFLKLFYGRFWLYAILQLIFSFGFNFLLQPFFNKIGIWTFYVPFYVTFLPSIPHFILIYLYHMWQERIFTQTENRAGHEGKRLTHE